MSKSANVRSTEALKEFRIAMCNFADDVRGALGGVEMELKRFRDWLERDQLGYWQMQVKRRHEMLMDARAALHKKKLAAGKSDAVSDSEEKENLRIATRLLRVAEEKVELVRKLIPQFHHAASEYHAHSQPLGDHMSAGFERSLQRLSAMIDAIENYLALQAPDTATGLKAADASRSAASTTSGTSAAPRPSAPPPEGETPAETPAAEPEIVAATMPQPQEAQP